MADSAQEIELVFEPRDDGGYRVYAPDLPGLHTQGDDLMMRWRMPARPSPLRRGLREDGEPFDSGVVRRTIPLPA